MNNITHYYILGMKNIISIVLVSLISTFSLAQNTFTSNNATPGTDFNTIGSWTGTGTPNFTNGLDKFIIRDGDNYTSSGPLTIEGLTLGEGAGGGALVLGSTLDLAGNLLLDVNSTLTAAANQINIAGNWTENTGASLSSSGTVVFDATLVQTISAAATFNNLTFNGGGVVSTGGNVRVNGNWVITNNTNFSTGNFHDLYGNLTVDDGSIYNATDGRLSLRGSVDQTLNIGANATFDQVYFQPGAPVNFNITGDYVANDLTYVYPDATLDGVGDQTMEQLIQNGTINFSGSITFTGNRINDTDDNVFGLGTADIIIDGNVYFSNATNGDAISIGGNLTIQSGLLVIDEGSVTGTGGSTFQINDGYTVYLRGVDNFPTGFGTVDFQGITSRANYDLRANQTIRGGITYARLALGAVSGTDTGSRIKTADGSLDINGYLDLNNGVTLDLATFNHTLEGNIYNVTNSGITQSAGSFTLDAPDANQTVQANGTADYFFKTFSIINTAPTAVRTINIDDDIYAEDFVVTNTGGSASNYLIVDIDDYEVLVGGFPPPFTISIGANVQLRTSGSSEFNSMMSNFTGTFDPLSTIRFDGGVQSIPGVTYGNVEIRGNGNKNATADFNVVGNFSRIAETPVFVDGGFSHTVSGNWEMNVAYTNNMTGSMDFNGADQTISGSDFNNVTFSGSGTKSLLGNLFVGQDVNGPNVGDFTISNGVTVNAGIYTIEMLGGHWVNGGTGVFNQNTGTVLFSSTQNGQNITSNPNNTFGDLDIDNNSKTVNAQTDIIVGRDFDLVQNNGAFNLQGFTLFIGRNFNNRTGTSFTFTLPAATLHFNGNVDQDIRNYAASTYPNMIFTGLGIKRFYDNGLDINGDVTITNTTLDAANLSHTVAGDWNNGGSFQHTQAITFDGADQSISASTFHDTFFSGTGTKTLTGNITLNGRLQINDGVTLDVSASNYKITVEESWRNQGTGVFVPQNGLVEFSGGYSQIFTGAVGFPSAGKQFWDVLINTNTSRSELDGDLIVENDFTINTGAELEMDAFDMYVAANFTNNGIFDFNSNNSLVTFNGSSGTHTIESGGSGFRYITFDAPGATYKLQSNISFNVSTNNTTVLTVNNGVFNLNGNEFLLSTGYIMHIDIVGGVLEVDAGASLRLGRDSKITNSGGVFKIVGTIVNPAVVNSIDPDPGDFFSYDQTGGIISAQYYSISNTTGNGFDISGGTIDNTNNFTNGVFSNGAGTSYLTLDVPFVASIPNVIFNPGPSFNVSAPVDHSGALVVDFQDALGGLAGEANDNDGFSQITWSFSGTGIVWDGGGDGSSWNDGNNWDSDLVPIASDVVFLDHSIVGGGYSVDILAIDAIGLKLIIDAGGANDITLTVKNSRTLDIEELMTIIDGSLIQENSSTIRLAGAWSNSGTYTANANTFILDGSSGVFTFNTNTDPFYNLTVDASGAQYNLDNNMVINNDFNMIGGTFNVVGNKQITLFGNWNTNGGTFIPGTGDVNFSKTSGSQSIYGGLFYDLSLNSGAAKQLTSNVTIKNDIIFSNAFVNTFNASSFIIKLGDDWINNRDATVFSQTGSGAVIFDGGSTQDITGSGITNFNSIFISGTGTKRVRISTNINKDLNILNGIGRVEIDPGVTVTGTAGGTLSQTGGQLRIEDTNNFPTGFGTVSLTGGEVLYYANIDQNIFPTTYFDLRIGRPNVGNTPTKTLLGDITVNDDLILNDTEVTLAVNNFTINLEDALVIPSGGQQVDWGVVGGTGTLNHFGNYWNIDADITGFNNLILGGVGGKYMNSALTITGDVTIADGLLLDMNGNTMTGTGSKSFTMLGTSRVITDNIADPLPAFPTAFGTYSLATTSRVTLNGSGNQIIYSIPTYGRLDLNSNGDATIDGNLNVDGDLTMNDNVTLVDAGFDMTFSGTNNDFRNYTPSISTVTVTFDGADQNIYSYSSASVDYVNLPTTVFAGSGTKSLVGGEDFYRINGDLTINSGVTVNLNRDMEFSGANFTNNGTFNHTNFTLNFNRTGVQTIDPGANHSLRTTRFENGGGTKTIVNNGLNIDAGQLEFFSNAVVDFGNLTHNFAITNINDDATETLITSSANLVLDRIGTQTLLKDRTWNNITFAGSGNKLIGGILTGNDIIINNGVNLFMSSDYGTDIGGIIVNGNWTNAGAFYDYTSTIAFESVDTNPKTIDNNGFDFYNITFNQSNTSARNYSLQSSQVIQEDLTIGSGATLDVNGFNLTLGNNDGGNPDAEQHYIAAGATLTISPGSTLLFDATDNGTDGTSDPDPTLIVDGTFNLVGTSGNLARIDRSAGNYRIDIDIQSGGTINARYYEISTLVDAGLDIQVGANVATSGANNNFSDGTWTGMSIANSGNRLYLNFEADATGLSDVSNVTFNHGGAPNPLYHFNVRRSAGAGGVLTFAGTINGLLAGETYEDDGDGTKIEWPVLSFTNWTGAISSDWSVVGNWDNGVPSNSLDAIIGLQTNNPVINSVSGNGAARSVTLTNGILTLDDGNDLNSIGDVIIGQGTANGILAVANAGSDVFISGGLTIGGNGIYIPGGGTFTFNAAGGTVTITPNNASLNNVTFTGAATYLVAGASIDIDGDVLISNGTLSFSTTNYTATIGGDMLNTGGTFSTSTAGTVILDGDAQTIQDVNFNDLTVSGTGTKTFQGSIDIADDLIVNSTLGAGTSAIVMNGDVVIASGGTFDDGNGSHTFYGQYWTGTGGYSGNGTIVFARTGNQYINASKFNNLDISGTNTKYLQGDTDLTGDLILRNSIASMRFNYSLINNTSGTGTMTAEPGLSMFVLGTNNFPSGFGTYALDATSLARYEGTNDQTVRGGVQYGRLYLLNANTKTLGGDIDVNGDLDFNTATLDVSVNNYEIKLAGEWDNNDGGSFIARNGQVVLDGSVGDYQNIRADITGTKDFYILRIDKSFGTARYLANGVDVSITNNLIVQNGEFRNWYNNRNLNVGGDINCIAGTIYTAGKYVMNKASGTGFITSNGSVFYDLEINTGGTYLVQDNLSVDNLFNVTSGIFDGNGKTIQLGNYLDVITISGTYMAGPGGRLEIGDRASLTVTPSGTLELVGTSGAPVTITRRTVNTYNFSVQGIIKAQYYLFEFMGVNGVKIENGAIIDATDNFSNGSFANGASGGTLFNIESTQDLTGNPGRIENVTFPSNPGGGATNVSKLIAGSGTVEFYDAIGAFAGSNFENDPSGLIDWTGTETLTWTAGAGTSDWFTAGNWESSLGGNKVPTATDLTIIDSNPVIQPIINVDGSGAGPAVAKSVTIDFGAILTLNTSVDDVSPDLDVFGDITINGLLITNSAADRIRIQGAWTRGGSGSFSQSTSKVNFATSGGVDVINNGTTPFYDLTIESGSFQLGSNTVVSNDFAVALGATFDVSSGNRQLTVGGDFTNAGTYNAQQGKLIFNNQTGAGTSNIDAGGDLFYDLTIAGGATTSFVLQSSATVQGDMTVSNGFFLLNSNTLNMGDGIGTDLLEITGATSEFLIGANGTLSMGNNSFVQVTNGIFKIVGTDGSNKAIINSQSGAYSFDVFSGGQLNAQFYEINNLNSNGLNIRFGASLDAAENLSDGSFSSGASGGRYLLLENDLGSDITLNNVVFNSGPAVNAKRISGTNAYIFNDASGVLAGVAFEEDDGVAGTGRVQWVYTSLNTWTGVTSSDWNTSSNWSTGNVPLATNDVVIPSGTPNNPVLSAGASGVAKDLTIQAGAVMEFNDAGGTELTLDGSFINSGTFTHTVGVFNVNGNWTNVGTYTAVANPLTQVYLSANTGNILIETGGAAFHELTIDSDKGAGDGDAIFQTVDAIVANNRFELLDGTLEVSDPTHTITINNITGTSVFAVNAAGTFVHGNGTINLQTTGTSISFESIGSNLYDVVTSGSGNVLFASAMTIDNNLTLGSNTDGGSSTINLVGNISNTGTFTSSSSTVSLIGGAVQTITSTGGISFNNLTVANSSGLFPQIILNDPVEVTGVLTLTDGIIASSVADFVHLNGGTLSGGSSASYVNGPMQRTGSGNFTFPVGAGLFYARIGAESLTGSNGFTAQYFDAAAPNPGNVSQGGAGPLNHVSGAEYWELTRSSGASNPLVKLYWEDGTRSDITDLSGNDLVVAHYTAGNWQSEGGIITGGSTTAVGSVLSTSALTSLSPITFGSAFNLNALPIELLSFEAEALQTTVKLTWETASELNNDYFTLLRSKDGVNFDEITTIIGAGDSKEKLGYSFIDERPYSGISYYKLMQTDFDGTTVDVGVVLVRMSNNAQTLQLVSYPNPFQNEAINLSLSGLNEEEVVTVMIVDTFGKQQFTHKSSADSSGYLDITVEESTRWNSGVYVIQIITEKGSIQSRVIKQ